MGKKLQFLKGLNLKVSSEIFSISPACPPKPWRRRKGQQIVIPKSITYKETDLSLKALATGARPT